MQVQGFIYGTIGVWVAISSSSLAHALPLSSFSVIERLAIASSQSKVDFERMKLLRSVSKTVRQRPRCDYQNRIDNIPMDTLGTLPAALANAVMQDAQERFNKAELKSPMAPDTPADIGVQVESIEPVTWNECGGGFGPSQPIRGICPNITVSGWRIVVAGEGSSEPLRLVYYIPEGVDAKTWTPQPDGLQSLSEAIQRRILAQIAKNAGVPSSSQRLFWADPRFFDRCLNAREGVPSCGMDIRSGWEVQVLVSQTTSNTPLQQPLWVYHTNFTGTEVRLVSKGLWMPPP
ncbi:MAG: hypothetical protein HC934_08765 [Acaryochloridaceae cyanobacterium SU_2_1]|nr:hypothetical protein [Acaryochloridaceae cyanobacterium SU_2_1]